MVIFHSYVELPEGRFPPNPSKPRLLLDFLESSLKTSEVSPSLDSMLKDIRVIQQLRFAMAQNCVPKLDDEYWLIENIWKHDAAWPKSAVLPGFPSNFQVKLAEPRRTPKICCCNEVFSPFKVVIWAAKPCKAARSKWSCPSCNVGIPSCWLRRITLLNPMKQWTHWTQWTSFNRKNIIVPTSSRTNPKRLLFAKPQCYGVVQNNFPKPQVAVSGHLTCCCKREFSAWLGLLVSGGQWYPSHSERPKKDSGWWYQPLSQSVPKNCALFMLICQAK